MVKGGGGLLKASMVSLVLGYHIFFVKPVLISKCLNGIEVVENTITHLLIKSDNIICFS